MGASEFEVGSSIIKYQSRRLFVDSTSVGTPFGVQNWELVKSKAPGVVVLPVNNEGLIGVIAQTRILPDNKSHRIWELPSGWMETTGHNVSTDEIYENANRELQEELGVKAQTLELLAKFRLSNFAPIPFYAVLGTSLIESKLTGDEIEKIDANWLSLSEAWKLLTEDQIPTAQVRMALLEYRLRLAK